MYVCKLCMFAQTEKLCKPQRKPFWMRYILWLWYSLASVFVFKLNQDLADLFEDKHSQMRCLNTAILWKYPRWFPMSWTLTLYTIFGSFCIEFTWLWCGFSLPSSNISFRLFTMPFRCFLFFSLHSHSQMKIQPEAQYFSCHALECKKVYSARFSIYKRTYCICSS